MRRSLQGTSRRKDTAREARSDPAHQAARGGHVKTLELLLRVDDSALRTPNKRKELPLHLAAFSGCPDACKVLLDAGATGATGAGRATGRAGGGAESFFSW